MQDVQPALDWSNPGWAALLSPAVEACTVPGGQAATAWQGLGQSRSDTAPMVELGWGCLKAIG